MTFESLDDLPARDPRPSEDAMIASLADSLASVQSSIATLQAREAMLLVAAQEVAELQTRRLPSNARDRQMPYRNAAAELGSAMRLSDRTVQARMSSAWTLMFRFPLTYTALGEGRISRAHATIIVEAGSLLDDDDARAAYEQQAVDRAHIETPGRLREIARALADRAETSSMADRHREARKQRGVYVRDLADGMSELLAVLPSVLAHGIVDRLTQMAHEVRQATDAAAADDAATLGADGAQVAEAEGVPAPGADGAPGADDARADETAPADDTQTDDRTLNQLRADILADMALGGAPVAAGDGLEAIRAHVQVTVPVLTLAGVHDAGAQLAGSGPIDADTARRLAGGRPGWDRVMTHPITGAVLAVDTYRPNADLQRALRVRDEHCRFPGCRMAVWRCDIDHSHDAALGGETSIDNLAHLCRGHHMLKHSQGWTIQHLGGGTLEWTSPSGRTYIDVPAPTLRFVPSDELWNPSPPDSGARWGDRLPPPQPRIASGEPPPF